MIPSELKKVKDAKSEYVHENTRSFACALIVPAVGGAKGRRVALWGKSSASDVRHSMRPGPPAGLRVTSLAAITITLLACSEPQSQADLAATSGWREFRFSDCCLVRHPQDLLLQPQRGVPVRADFAEFARPGLQVFLEFQPAEFDPKEDAEAPPGRDGWRQDHIEVEGHDGLVIRDESEAPGFEGGQSYWALILLPDRPRGPLSRPEVDGRGMQLILTANCRSEEDCAVLDLMIATLDFPPLRNQRSAAEQLD